MTPEMLKSRMQFVFGVMLGSSQYFQFDRTGNFNILKSSFHVGALTDLDTINSNSFKKIGVDTSHRLRRSPIPLLNNSLGFAKQSCLLAIIFSRTMFHAAEFLPLRHWIECFSAISESAFSLLEFSIHRDISIVELASTHLGRDTNTEEIHLASGKTR